MKKTQYLFGIIAVVAMLSLSGVAKAKDDGTSTGSDNSGGPAATSAQNREKLRLASEDANQKMEDRASTTNEREDISGDNRQGASNSDDGNKSDDRNASTSSERRDNMKTSRLDSFNMRKDSLVRQLDLSVSNLEQIAARITSRIQKAEQEGHDMTEAKNLLASSTAKIAAAKIAIQAVVDFQPGTSTVASTTVDLLRPRVIGAAAIKAVKDAHAALVLVVRSIARVTGVSDDGRRQASTTDDSSNSH